MALPKQYLQRLDSLRIHYEVVGSAAASPTPTGTKVMVVSNECLAVQGQPVLVLQAARYQVDRHKLATIYGVDADSIQPATPTQLTAVGATSGHVSALTLPEDTHVPVVLSRQLVGRAALAFDLGAADQLVVISSADLLRFLRNLGVAPRITSVEGVAVQED
ncbi:YbaK/EbsC family protein [Lacticaseibacillus thailandensis]|nr:YbaK/EbsC family protein [Lacticaseibacillus thailandensis]